VPPTWYNGPCGESKYANAGDMNLPFGAKSRMIVGGIDAQAHEFPWQTSMRTKSTNSHFCGGFIINERWVMTAAHCMVGQAENALSVVIGEHTRNDATNTQRQMLNVATGDIYIHKDYDRKTYENDIALVKVIETISFTEDVQPVCAPEASDLYEYQKTVCSGWGTISSGGTCCPQTLKYVSMNITTNAFCDVKYPTYDIFPDMICATDNTGSTDRDSCQGDSGGPLVVKGANGIFSVVGIVSWGVGCASGYPGVYNRVSFHESWILTTMGM
jgi:trypsin